MDPYLIIDRKSIKLEFFPYATNVIFKGLPDGRHVLTTSEVGADVFEHLLKFCYFQCRNDNELQHYIAEVRQIVGDYLFDQNLCSQLKAALIPSSFKEEG